MQSNTSNIDFNGLKIQYICNPRLKHSYISIDKQANVILKTPNVSSSFVNKLLSTKEPWIRQKLKNIQLSPPIKLSLDGIDSKESKDYLAKRVDYFANIMGLRYSELKFRKMKSRWGSCSNRGVITLNKKLIKTPSECIDYVIVHELAHLTHMNHSKKFHQLVEKYFPQANSAKDTLSKVVFVT